MVNKVSELCCDFCNTQTSGRLRRVSKQFRNGGPQQNNKQRRNAIIALQTTQNQLDRYTEQLRKLSKQERNVYDELGWREPRKVHPKLTKIEERRDRIYKLRNKKRSTRTRLRRILGQQQYNSQSPSTGTSNASSAISSASSCNSNCSTCIRL